MALSVGVGIGLRFVDPIGYPRDLVGPPLEFITADGFFFMTADGVYFGVLSHG